MSYYIHSTEYCEVFRNEGFVTKLMKLSKTMTKSSFPNLKNYLKINLELKNNSVAVKEIAQTQNIIDNPRCQGVDMSDILKYDLLSNHALFCYDFTSKPDKYMLVKKPNKRKQYGTWRKRCISCRRYVTHSPYTLGSIINVPRSFECYLETKCDPIHLKDTKFDKRHPIQPQWFWASGSNKKLQILSRIYFKNISEINKAGINVSRC